MDKNKKIGFVILDKEFLEWIDEVMDKLFEK